MKDYHGFYLKLDVLLLADAFENFKNSSLKNHWLCPTHYLSAPALSWDAILNMTRDELELILDAEKYLFFEDDMRGGVSYICKRYSQASNKYLKSYDPKQQPEHIIYLDAKNLYVYPMWIQMDFEFNTQ